MQSAHRGYHEAIHFYLHTHQLPGFFVLTYQSATSASPASPGVSGPDIDINLGELEACQL